MGNPKNIYYRVESPKKVSKVKRIGLVKVCLIISVLFNLIAIGFGILYLQYWGFSIPYAISRVPDIVQSVIGPYISRENLAVQQVVIEERPQLKTAGITDYEKVCIIRDWAAETIDSSSPSLRLSSRIKNINSISAYEMYSAFANDQSGVLCGGSAHFLMKVYQAFGFDAGRLGIGFSDLGSHVITLVQIEQDGEKLISVQDANLNVTYESVDGKPMDYIKMLCLLKERRESEIVITEPETPLVRDYLSCSGDVSSERRNCTYVGLVNDGTAGGNSIAKYSCIVGSSAFTEEQRAALSQRGLPPEDIYLHLFPNSIGYISMAKELFEEANQITGEVGWN